MQNSRLSDFEQCALLVECTHQQQAGAKRSVTLCNLAQNGWTGMVRSSNVSVTHVRGSKDIVRQAFATITSGLLLQVL